MEGTVRQHLLLKRRKAAAICLLAIIAYIEDMSDCRRMWVKPWIARRKDKGVHHNLFVELQLEDPNKYRRALRMDCNTFEALLAKVTPLVVKQTTHLREPISPAERLSITLRHLATGQTQADLSLVYRVGQSTISGIIHETCRAIATVLIQDYMRFPSSHEEWRAVAADCYERWNFPNCMGAMDGKHCVIEPPLKSGSHFYNYKNQFSVILMAVVDAQLRFIFVDVVTNGRVSDSGVWSNCSLKQKLDDGTLTFPPARKLPNSNIEFPHVLVGDEGFPLAENLLIPYPRVQCTGRMDKRIFNYRLSRMRRVSENAFGLLAARFQIFRSPLRYDPDDATAVILACCCLHNYLRTLVVGRAMYTPPGMLDEEDVVNAQVHMGDWRAEPHPRGLLELGNQGGNRHREDALRLRDILCEYFNTIGTVPWQNRMVR